MKIKELFKPNDLINIHTYLAKCGVKDTTEYLKGGASGIEPPDRYENMEEGYELLMEVVNE